MIAAGSAVCAVCGAAVMAYKPRGWRAGDPLAVWAHSQMGSGLVVGKCRGSYKPARTSQLARPAVADPRPDLCGTCRHYEAETPIGGHCTDTAPNPMAAKSCGPAFGCVFYQARGN